MSSTLDRAVSMALIAGTIAIAGSVVFRNLGPGVASRSTEPERPTRVESWTSALRFGSTILGDAAAPITILELTDLECPACRGFQTRLKQLAERHPRSVRIVYLAYPLSIHRFAMGAARAADCALDISPDALSRWIDAVYAGQDSLGLRSWGSYASDAGIGDTTTIAKCASSAQGRMRVDSSLAFGQRLDINGTPSIIINGWRDQGLPSDRAIDELIATLERGSPTRTIDPAAQ
jgi:protein-disulfide isomerase